MAEDFGAEQLNTVKTLWNCEQKIKVRLYGLKGLKIYVPCSSNILYSIRILIFKKRPNFKVTIFPIGQTERFSKSEIVLVFFPQI